MSAFSCDTKNIDSIMIVLTLLSYVNGISLGAATSEK